MGGHFPTGFLVYPTIPSFPCRTALNGCAATQGRTPRVLRWCPPACMSTAKGMRRQPGGHSRISAEHCRPLEGGQSSSDEISERSKWGGCTRRQLSQALFAVFPVFEALPATAGPLPNINPQTLTAPPGLSTSLQQQFVQAQELVLQGRLEDAAQLYRTLLEDVEQQAMAESTS
ncbi:hypothetical protein CYMTET_20298, partial [Cymbomonas tetramitiformis]